jgi:hypothetical protein
MSKTNILFHATAATKIERTERVASVAANTAGWSVSALRGRATATDSACVGAARRIRREGGAGAAVLGFVALQAELGWRRGVDDVDRQSVDKRTAIGLRVRTGK